MKCWNCGAELEEGVSFCSRCGRKQLHEGSEQLNDDGKGEPSPPSAPPNQGYSSGGTGANGGNNTIILTIFSIVCLAVYGYGTIQAVLRVVVNLFHWFTSFIGLFYLVANLLLIVGGVWICLMLVMIAFKRTPANSNGLIICLAGGGLVNIASRVLFFLINLFSRGAVPASLKNLMITILGAVVATGGVYAIIRFVLGEPAITSFDTDTLSNDVRAALASFTKAAGDVTAQASQAAHDAQARQQQAAYTQQPPQGSANGEQQAQQFSGQSGQVPPPQPEPSYQQPGQVPPLQPGFGIMRLKTDRSIILYILLTLVTCGIYSLYFIYCLARDVNTVCAGDGQKTNGLGMYILLSIVTCGIYPIIWMYGLGNRLAANGSRYGMNFQENGTTILLWYVVGFLLCGIGPLVAMNIVIKNTNSLCTAYNIRNGV